MTEGSPWQRFQFFLVRVVGAIVWRLPERWAASFGTGLGFLAGSVLRIRRRVVEENLALAFPERPPAWRRRVAGASYRHLAREGVALLRLERMDPAEVRSRCRLEGFERIHEALDAGRGVLVLTGHLGNWEIAGAGTALAGVPLDVVARVQANPQFDEKLRRMRERYGMRVIDRDSGALRRLLRSLRSGRAVALLADQNVREGGVFVDFFGTPAATARGPGVLAARTGASVVVGIAHRLSGGRAEYRIRIVPVHHQVTGDPETDLKRLTQTYVEILEEGIREAPEQYFWLHRRWKTRPSPPNA